MPELPEVELISRSLNMLLRGRIIESAFLLREKLAPSTSPECFSGKLRSATINFVHRRGKHILFDLSCNNTLMVHLRMSGRFSVLPNEAANPKFSHALFYLDNDKKLIFDDQRHFGFMNIVATADLPNTAVIARLAPEPFSDEFSTVYLYKKARAYRRSLKEFLLDQSKVCGLGNIYACEAMFRSGLDPRRAAAKLSGAKAKRLHESIRSVLQKAILDAADREIDPENLEGSYFSGSGEAGWYVYDREKDPCLNCNTSVIRLKQGGRSTYYCPLCQKG